MILKVTELGRYFDGPHGRLHILRSVNLELNKGQMTYIVGRSGAGKSTLLHLLGGLDRPTSGSVEFGGKMIHKLGEKALAEYRNRKIGFVFQFYHLLPELTVKENVVLPALIAGRRLGRRADDLLKQVGLGDRRKHLPSELSGGEQQRAAIARALINSPELVFCDEPTGNLDEETADSVHELLIKLSKEGQTFCIVTHDESLMQRGDRVYRLHEGAAEKIK